MGKVPIRLVLATGLLLIGLAVVAVLSRSPATLAQTNGIPLATTLVHTGHPTRACQSGETLPRETSALRLALFSMLGPRITVRAYAGSQIVTQGAQHGGWDGTDIVVPVRRVPRTTGPVTVCLQLDTVDSEVSLLGAGAPGATLTVGGRALPDRMRIEYLRPGRATWWSYAGTIVRNIGFGHALSGGLNVVLALELATAVLALSSWLILRDLR